MWVFWAKLGTFWDYACYLVCTSSLHSIPVPSTPSAPQTNLAAGHVRRYGGGGGPRLEKQIIFGTFPWPYPLLPPLQGIPDLMLFHLQTNQAQNCSPLQDEQTENPGPVPNKLLVYSGPSKQECTAFSGPASANVLM